MPIIRSLFVAIALLAGPALAEERPVVVELFTSQGCSSCPPADAFLGELAERDDVIALALHVDYWDYIGWEDVFADPAYTRRQHEYAYAGGRRMVYTPQIIVNGRDDVIGTKLEKVEALIGRNMDVTSDVNLTVMRDGDTLRIRAEAGTAPDAPMMVQLLRYIPRETVEIKRGENAGRTLSYANIVTHLEVLRDWDGRKPLSLDVPISGGKPAVILIQRAGHGPVEAVAQLD